MAMSAFKSSSRRGNSLNTSTTNNKISSDKESKQDSTTKKVPPPRRSRSVSAFSRTHLDISSSNSNPDPPNRNPNEFLNKRENPLFWTNTSPPDLTKTKSPEIPTKSAVAEDTRRGRSVSRNADAGKTVSGIGRRSLSRVDTGRRGRSVSRCPTSRGQYVNSESEVEIEDALSVNYKDRNKLNTAAKHNGEKIGLARSTSDMLDQIKCLAFESSDGSATNLSRIRTNWGDGVSTSSVSEAEEKTIKAVCEQIKSFQGDTLRGDASPSGIYETVRSEVRRAISDIQNDLASAMRRSNTTPIAAASVTDISPDLVSPGAVELVLDIRREYAKKLEQSQERATKLRADLAVEEHRGLELSRILKEVLPDPKLPSVQKLSRAGRKSSMERRKMSKRLTEEAMTYFDECVSLSTFDSSDFSSPEDPPLNLVGTATSAGDSVSFPHGSLSVSASCGPNNPIIDKQEGWFTHTPDAIEQMASSSSKERAQDQASRISTDKVRGPRFSFGCKTSETFDLQQDLMKYVKNFEKDVEKVNTVSQIATSTQYDVDEYNLRASPQTLLFDRVFCKNRIESGSFLLCGGGTAFSSSPFASII